MRRNKLFDNSRVSTEQKQAALKNSKEAVLKIAEKERMNKHLLEMGKDIQEEVLKLREEGQAKGGNAIRIYTYLGRLEDVIAGLEDKLSRRNMQIRELKKGIKDWKESFLKLKYDSQFKVIEGLNQHPTGLGFNDWKLKFGKIY